MNVLQNLVELYNQLPCDSTYRVVAKGILENMNKMSDVSIYDIAELTNSSRTTVWRMVQKMGYKTFSDFRYALQTAVSQYSYYNRILPMQEILNEKDIIPQFLSQLQMAQELMEQNFSTEKFIELADILHGTERISFYLPYRIYPIYSLQQNLAMDGKKTGYFCLLPEMLQDAETLDENSIIFVNTIEYAETMDMSPVFSIAKSKGSKIYLLNTRKSRYRSYADCFLFDFELKEGLNHAWNIMFENYIILLSEIYRSRFIK